MFISMAIFSSFPHSFFFLMILTIAISKNILVPVHAQCLEDQKTLLLELKRELKFDPDFHPQKLASWNQTHDCCSWYGVECDNAGRVISLQLDFVGISGGLNESSSLFRLRYLEKLNLANNFFTTQKIPRAIHHLTHLTHLIMSYSGFAGQVPIELSLLRRLVVLDISSTWFFDQTLLEIPNLKILIRNLTSLREVYLDGVDISGAGSEWCQTISSSLPHLRVLSLRYCMLSGPFCPSLSRLHSLYVVRLDWNDLSTTVPDSLANFSRLTTFSCSDCSLRGSIIPKMMLQVPTLQELDLSFNKLLGGTIPQFRLSRALRSIDVSSCSFVGPIPSTFANLTELVHLDLSYNFVTGVTPSFYMWSKKLTYIGLQGNSLMGSLSDRHFEGLSILAQLYLSGNSLSGSIPASTIFALPSLVVLDLSHNQFSGQINEFSSIVNFSHALFSINLSYNKLGSIPHSFFALPSLFILILSNNQFSGQVKEFPIVNNSIDFLDLSSNRLEGPISDFSFQLQSLRTLRLSHNLFNGSFHLEKLKRFPNLTDLDLSYNNLSVDAPNIDSSLHGFPNLQTLRLASCNLTDFPGFIKQSNMTDLDLSNNRIAGDIPSWIWEIGNGTLTKLNLSFNLLVNLQKPYHIPSSLGTLDLHSNQLRGELPPLAQGSYYVDYSNNYFHSSIPSNIITHSPIYFLSLANNSLSGAIPTSLCNISGLVVLDLSFNNFTGIIPPCLVENSTENLGVLNLRGNNINGVIPDQFFINCSLRTLDLSHNHLGGKIPKSLETCQGLEVMNVGYNNFDDSFPCMLSSSLHVLVLRSNRFHGEWRCDKSWPSLQIVDISSNNFSGSLHRLNFSTWRGMMLQNDAHLRPNRSSSNFLGHEHSIYYKDQMTVTLTVKGIEVNLVKIWPDFTSIDLSCNNFHGVIPDEVGNLTSLYLLNLSHNALTASIPKSLGALMELESLDLSANQLRGRIPEELAHLTFLSFLNLSYNELVGMIPIGPQFNTFSANSFEGNTGLCGSPVNRNCSSSDGNGSTAPEKEKDDEIEWEYVCAAAGYVVGLGSIAWILLFFRRFRERYFDKIEDVVENIFYRRDHRRRRKRRRSSVARRNEVRRH